MTEGRQGHPYDGRRVAFDAVDEGAAEAVDRERACHLEGFAGRDVRGDLVVCHVGREGHGCLGYGVHLARGNRGPHAHHGVPGVQHARPAAHLAPARGGVLGSQRLSEHRAVELEHRVPADHDAVEGRVVVGEAGRDVRSFAPCEQQDVLVGSERAALGGLHGVDHRLFIDVRRDRERTDAELLQQHEPSGRGRGEAHAHGTTVAVASPQRCCGMLDHMARDDLIDLEITGVAHGGVFVGRHEGRVVFVPDAIPGERVRVRLTETAKSSFWRGETLEILDASPHRRPHVWRQADVDVAPELRPGGADFGHIDLDHQRELKLRVLLESFERIGRLPTPLAVAMESARAIVTDDGVLAEETPDGTGWRTRVSLHVDADGRVGPYAARSHRVIAVDDLPLATSEVERLALELRTAEPGRIDLVQPADGRVRVLPHPERTRPPRSRDRRPSAPAPKPDPRKDPRREVVVERVGGRDFRVDAGGFWQVHRLAAHSLTAVVAAELTARGGIDSDAWHLDLYGGVGLFAATLGDLGGPSTRVTTVESDARATEHAGDNLAEWVGARAETGRVDRWLARLQAEASATERERVSRGVVLLDPPRAGAGRDVVEAVAGLSPATIVYVACDPVALARDLATFAAAGYEASGVQAVDLFPNSHHVEAVATLTRTPSRG